MRLASVFDCAKEAMLVVDEHGRIVLFNKASESLFGRPANRAIGTHVASLAPAELAVSCESDPAAYFRNAERAGQVRFVDGNGDEFAADLSFSNVSGGADAQYMLIVRPLRHQGMRQRPADPTADLMRNARMAAIDEMSAAFTHKLNQPLTAALLYLQTIERIYGRETGGGRLPDRVASILGKAIHETERASSTLQGMRQFLEQRESMPRPIDLNRTLEETMDIFSLVDRAEGPVARELAPHLPAVMADPGQLQQLLVDLIRGAMEAMAACEPCGIRVATRQFDDHIAVVVETNGSALSGGAANGRPDRPDRERMHGEALASARAIARDHGGDLVVDSGEQEQGTRFTLRLPVRACSPPA